MMDSGPVTSSQKYSSLTKMQYYSPMTQMRRRAASSSWRSPCTSTAAIRRATAVRSAAGSSPAPSPPLVPRVVPVVAHSADSLDADAVPAVDRRSANAAAAGGPHCARRAREAAHQHWRSRPPAAPAPLTGYDAPLHSAAPPTRLPPNLQARATAPWARQRSRGRRGWSRAACTGWPR